jgi:hypothetical protein
MSHFLAQLKKGHKQLQHNTKTTFLFANPSILPQGKTITNRFNVTASETCSLIITPRTIEVELIIRDVCAVLFGRTIVGRNLLEAIGSIEMLTPTKQNGVSFQKTATSRS